MTTNSMKSAVLDIAHAILATEVADDRAIASIGRLIAATADSRANTGLAARVGQMPLQLLADQLAERLGNRRKVMELHTMLGRIAAEEGEDPETWGPGWPCPKGRITAEPVQLSVAA